MQQITEEMKVHTEWYEEAKKQTLETLPAFLKKIMEEYGHDYGTICHALAAGGIATMCSMNKHEQGGITGFQSGAVMWEFIRHWNYDHNKCGLRLVDYDNMLYPQYEDSFSKTISESNWKRIKEEAINKIKEADEEHETYLKKKEQYALDIKAYVEKYPDYYDRKEYYDELSMGTGAQWEQQRIKKESGFEFAPKEPFLMVDKKAPVYQHWISISRGNPPFGFKVVKD